MEDEETVRRAFYGQTGMPTGLRQTPRIGELLAKYPIGEPDRISFRRGAMRIGTDTYWVAALIAQEEARDLVKFVQSKSG
jgi:hypothetical protein